MASTLEELAKNAIPPKPDNKKQPIVYTPPGSENKKQQPAAMPDKSNRKEVADPRSLGAPPPPPPPTIYDKWMSDLDKAIQRDKEQMWENVVKPGMAALQANMMFGEGGEEAYFNGDITDDQTQVNAQAVKIIELPPDVLATNKTQAAEAAPEDDFLNDNSIYNDKENSTTMANVPKPDENTKYLPGFEHYAQPGYQPSPSAVVYKSTENGVKTASIDGIMAAKEEQKEAAPVEAEFAVDQITAGSASTTPMGPVKFDDGLIEAAFADAEDEVIEETDGADGTEEELSPDVLAMQDFVKSNIPTVSNVVDLRDYKVSTRPATAGKALTVINNQAVHTAKWILPATGVSIIMSALKGTEIDLLANRRQGQTDLMRNEEIVKLFYNHVVSPKPATWKEWAKTILYDDLTHLYFAAYIACFAKSNFAPFECEKDKHQFMMPIDIMSMVKYKNQEAEAYCRALYEKDPDSTKITSTLRQISDDVAIAFRKPTIWNVMFEDYYLPDKVRRELSDIVAIFRHIENMYIINRDDKTLEFIDTKPDAANITKTLKNRFKIYYDVLKSLSSDQLNSITPIMSKLHDQIDAIRYQYPEVTCPKCGSIIKPVVQQPIDILFTRHRLQIILA